MSFSIFQGIMQAQAQEQEKFSLVFNDFVNANCLFALFLIVFVMFFCVRMVSSTSFALKAIILSLALFMGYAEWKAHEVLPILKLVFNGVASFTGLVIFLVGCLFLFKGLSEEEKTEEYVHNRFYWFCSIVTIYAGLLVIVYNAK